MKKIIVGVLTAVFFAGALSIASAQPALTIYNQDFAVVRNTIQLDLVKGINSVESQDVTALLEPDSLILRDPTGAYKLQILEQNYQADPVSQELLLSLYEGKTIDFLIQKEDKAEIVQGKIIRSDYIPRWEVIRQYGYYAPSSLGSQPIIEVDGKIRFGLPGIPLFPSLTDETILKPTIKWLVEADKKGTIDAELCYITGGFNWQAAYNIVAPEKGDVIDLVGWVTIDNKSGKAFENAKIKLMAGDVNKIAPAGVNKALMREGAMDYATAGAPPVTEKTFDEYHLYTLARPTTLLDREIKQVEFIRASEVKAQRIYVYDGLKIDQYRYWDSWQVGNEAKYGTDCNTKVWVMQEIVNSKANNLGMPLPKGRVRFYRRDNDLQQEFTGEDTIDHTPADETVRFNTGNAFDITGERKQTNFIIDTNRRELDESFEIKLRNHKKEAVTVRIVEHLYRWNTWDIKSKTDAFTKKDSKTIEFAVQIPPDGEKTVEYLVHYTW